MILSTRQLGELLGLTERHIYNLEKGGVLKKENKNEWNAPINVQNYINYKVDLDGSNTDYGKVKIRRELADAKLKELVYKEKMGSLLSLEEIAKELEDIAVVVSNKLYSLPKQIRARFNIQEEVQKALEDLVHEILLELKDPKIYEERAKDIQNQQQQERMKEQLQDNQYSNLEDLEDVEPIQAIKDYKEDLDDNNGFKIPNDRSKPMQKDKTIREVEKKEILPKKRINKDKNK